ncbi:MAG: hypothetical protein V4590_12940 [Bacteroidota bacterium]
MYCFSKKLWFITSVIILVCVSCKSKEKSAGKEPEPRGIEQPKPVMEPQTDSLKKVLDEQRRLKKGQ